LNKILDSIQVHMREVHVRYEDIVSNPSEAFFMGITLEAMHMQTAAKVSVTITVYYC
jgi:Vacuolar sorting-associated protein 13, N-terminal